MRGSDAEVFGIGTNQSVAVQQAKDALRFAEHNLRSAQKTLDNTPRTENRKATEARDACQRAVNSAKANLNAAEAAVARAR